MLKELKEMKLFYKNTFDKQTSVKAILLLLLPAVMFFLLSFPPACCSCWFPRLSFILPNFPTSTTRFWRSISSPCVLSLPAISGGWTSVRSTSTTVQFSKNLVLLQITYFLYILTAATYLSKTNTQVLPI